MPEFRTPYETAPAPPYQVGTRLGSEKIASDIARLRLRTVKRIVLALLAIVAAGAVGVTWKAAFAAGTITLASVAATIVFAAFLPLVALALKWYFMAITNLLASFFMIAPFFGAISSSLFIAVWLAVSLVAIFAGTSGQLRNRVYLSFSMSALAGAIGLLISGFSFLFTGLHYGTALAPRGEAAPQFFVSERGIAAALRMGQGVAQRFLPGFRAEMSVGEYIDITIEGRKDVVLAELREDPAFLALPPSQQRLLEAEAVARSRQAMREGLSRAIGKPINVNQSLASFLRDYLSDQVLNVSPETRRLMIVAWLVLVFLSAWSVGALVKPIISLVAWILLQLLLGVRIFEISRETAERKYLALA